MADYLSHLPERLSEEMLCLVDPEDSLPARVREDVRFLCQTTDDTPHRESRALGALTQHHSAFLLAQELIGIGSIEWAAVVTPVTQAADLRDVRISALPRLKHDETQAAIGELNALLREDPSPVLRHLRVRLSDTGDVWFLVGENSSGPVFEAAAAKSLLGQPLRDHPITGRDANLIKRWLTEVQMMMHAADWSHHRAEKGLAPVNGVWLHGAGPRPSLESTHLPALISDHPLMRGLWKCLGATIVTADRLGGHVLCAKDKNEAALDSLLQSQLQEILLLTPSVQMVVRRARWHHRLWRLAGGRP